MNPDLTLYRGPVLVTIAYIFLYYAFIVVFVLRTKIRLKNEYHARGESFDRYFGGDREMLAADRIQLNMLEHMAPFLVLMWLNAVFVNVSFATAVGALYVASRLVYPLTMGSKLGSGVPNLILLSTVPGYGVIAAYAAALIWALMG